MKNLIFSIIIVFTLVILPSQTHSESEFKKQSPCVAILEPIKGMPKNARGVALIYNIEREFNDKRTSLSLHALHLPKPASIGNFDRYELLAYIPSKISWIFRLYPITENQEITWAGKLDEVSPILSVALK